MFEDKDKNTLPQKDWSFTKVDFFSEPKPSRIAEFACDENRSTLPLKEYSIPLDSGSGFDRVVVRLSSPPLPKAFSNMEFAEHPVDPESGEPSRQVILCGKGELGVSNDLGETWHRVVPSGVEGIRFWNCFTRADGGHIVQSLGWQGPSDISDPQHHAAIFVFDKDWRLEGKCKPGDASWHGSASIGQSGNTIIFAEYFNNSERYREDFEARHHEFLPNLRANSVFRSRDSGLSWKKVFEMPPLKMRHFHTVQPDRFTLGRWWLSSGDKAEETHIWRSDDDGDTWVDVTHPAPDVLVPPSHVALRRACQRYTDVIIGKDFLLWGADDLLGLDQENISNVAVGGARMFVTGKSEPLAPRDIGYIGQPVRSLVEVGPAWMILTEAKQIRIGRRPQVFLLFKKDYRLVRLFDVDNYINRGTGFTYSRASRAAVDGTFFCFRSGYDAFRGRARVLKWQIEFKKVE